MHIRVIKIRKEFKEVITIKMSTVLFEREACDWDELSGGASGGIDLYLKQQHRW